MSKGDAISRIGMYSNEIHHYLLNKDPKSLINRVLQAQINNPSKNDFILGVESNLEEAMMTLKISIRKLFTTL